MTTSLIFRRSVAVLASAGATAALALLPATGAHAAVKAQFAAQAQSGASYTGSGGGSCNLSSGTSNSQSTPIAFSRGTKSASITNTGTFTNSLDSGDTVTVKSQVKSTATLKKHHKDLASLSLLSGGSIKISHSSFSSDCQGSGAAVGVTQTLFTEHHKGWLYLTRDTKDPNSVSEVELFNATTGKPLSFEIYQGGQSHAVSRALLKPGKYVLLGVVGITANTFVLKSAQRVSKIALNQSIQAQFKPKK